MDFNEFKKRYLKKEVVEYVVKVETPTLPLVTIRVVAYNHEPYIRQCLDSLLIQKADFKYEILIAEDESTDKTREVCMEYADKYPEKIRLILGARENNIKINGKPTGLFNAIYSNFITTSKYLALCEADDYWTDELSLQKRVDALEENPELVLCFHNSKKLMQETGLFNQNLLVSFKEDTFIEKRDILNTYIPTASIIFRNNLIDKFDEKMIGIVSGDAILRGKLSEFGKALYLNNISPSVYRIHKGGMFSTNSLEIKISHAIEARKYLIDHFKNKNLPTHHIKENISRLLFKFFFTKMKKNLRLDLSLLKEGRAFAYEANTSAWKIFYSGLIKAFFKL